MSKYLKALIEETKNQYLAQKIDLENAELGGLGNRPSFVVNAHIFLKKFIENPGFFDLEFATRNFNENQFSAICEMVKKLAINDCNLKREFKITYYNFTNTPQAKHLFELLATIEFEILNFRAYGEHNNVTLCSSDIALLGSVIQKQKGLKKLKLARLTRSDGFSDDIATTLANAIRDNIGIEELDLSCSHLSTAQAGILGNVLGRHPSIHTLCLAECMRAGESINPLLEQLTHNPRLQHLHVTPVESMGARGVNLLAELISANTLVSLNLNSGYRAITSEGATLLANALSKNISLRFLDLSHCLFAFEDMLSILQACANEHCKVEVLDLTCCNKIKTADEGNNIGTRIAALLTRIPCLRILFLADNQFNNPNLLAISNAAANIPQLQVLDITRNEILKGIKPDPHESRELLLPRECNILLALAKATEKNPNIQKIYLLEEALWLGRDERHRILLDLSKMDEPSKGFVFYSWWITESNKGTRVDPQYIQATDRIAKACLRNRRNVIATFCLGSRMPATVASEPKYTPPAIYSSFFRSANFERNMLPLIFDFLAPRTLLFSKAAAAESATREKMGSPDAVASSSSSSASASSACAALPPRDPSV